MRLVCSSKGALGVVRVPLGRSHLGNCRLHSTKPYDVAVIGGGITGLTAAYRLSRDPRCKKVTLYESKDRLGGWMQSDTVTVENELSQGKLVLERGPRTLRAAFPTALPLLDLLLELDLQDDVVITRKDSPATTNRYIYYPDHLVRMPAPRPNESLIKYIRSLIKTVKEEPLFEGMINALWREFRHPPAASGKPDESIADFISRRFSPKMADNLVSAVMAGIFAGDINRLSAQTLMGTFRNLEMNGGSVLRNIVKDMLQKRKYWYMDDTFAYQCLLGGSGDQDYAQKLQALYKDASVFTFKEGLEQLPRAITEQLKKSKNVDIVTSADIRALIQDPMTHDLTVDLGGTSLRTHNRVIATVKPLHLANMIPQRMAKSRYYPAQSVKNLRADNNNYAVTVMVINLYYKEEDHLDIPRGFGYLIPRSVPFEQNPERALGVIFGNETSVGQDTVDNKKLTVMLGGHWWDGLSESEYPDHEKAYNLARSVLRRHLNITAEPLNTQICLHVDAIPQYTVGHLDRMNELSQTVRTEYHKRLTLAGSWYGTNGIGVLDCVRQGYLAGTFGVGARKLKPTTGSGYWSRYDWQNWDLEGGIVTSPVRYAEVNASDANGL